MNCLGVPVDPILGEKRMGIGMQMDEVEDFVDLFIG